MNSKIEAIKDEFSKNAPDGYELIDISHKRVGETRTFRWLVTTKCDKGHSHQYRYRGKFSCKVCSYANREIRRRSTNEDIQSYLNEHASGYMLLDSWIDKKLHRIKVMCDIGHEYDVFLNDFKVNEHRCKECYFTNGNRKLNEQIEDYFLNNKEGYKLLEISNRISNGKKTKTVLVRCPNNHEYYASWSHFKGYGAEIPRRCCKCNASQGEQEIMRFLNNNDFSYIHQYRFDDCRDKNRLPFDFAVFSGNRLICLIEYDGEQHYHPVKWSTSISDEDAEKEYQDVIYRDAIKSEYCRTNKINLIRLPYWELENINGILNKKLEVYNYEAI